MLKLEVKKRDAFGEKTKSLLTQGLIPAEIYGHGFENIHASVPAKEFNKIFKEAGESTLVTLSVEGKMFPVLIHEVAKDTLGDAVVHVDFYRVQMDKKIRTQVSVHFVGEAPAVKEKGGVFIKSIDELEVEALPSDLPHVLDIDLSGLTEIHQGLHVKDIKVPQGVKILADPEMGVASVGEKQKEEVIEETPTPQEEAAAPAAEGEITTALPAEEQKQK